MPIPALSMGVPKGPFAIVVWIILAILPPLVAFYRERDWRIPWWHWPVAVALMCLAAKLAFDYTFAHLCFARWTLTPGDVRMIAIDSFVELIRFSLWFGIPVLLGSVWLTARRRRCNGDWGVRSEMSSAPVLFSVAFGALLLLVSASGLYWWRYLHQ